MGTDGNRGTHFDLALLFAEVAAAQEEGDDPDGGYGYEEDDEHYYPFVVC